MTKWAIVGLGFIAPRHKKGISHIGGEVILTCDIDKSKQPDHTNWHTIMKDPKWKEVTHVAICAPNDLHYRMARDFAEDGKIVLCEKPLTLNSEQAMKLPKNVYTVLQLRFNKDIAILKNKLNDKGSPETGRMIVKVKRDQKYWDSWKGDENKSGGILFNLGVHYFDLLIYLLGNNYKIIETFYSPKKAFGKIDFNGCLVDYHLEMMDTDNGQKRIIELGGEEIMLSDKDNLSFEGLHNDVYSNLILNCGVSPWEATKSIQLCELLKKNEK